MKKHQLTLSLKNSLAELDTLYSQVETYGQSIGLTEKCVFEINLVLDELFTNIIEYAYPDQKDHLIKITLANKDKQLVLTVEDDGVAFNPLQVEQPNTDCPCEDRKIGGLGLHLIKQIMSDMHYERRGRKNVLILTKALEN